MELLMVTKNRRNERGFRNKFGMTRLKFGMLLLLVLFFTSCSFYEELRNNPRLKDGGITAPESFTGIMAGEENGVITLEWSQVEGAEKYEIYCFEETNTIRKTASYLEEKAKLVYTFEASHIKNNVPRLEVSNMYGAYYNFFIKAVSKTGRKSIFCKEYVRVYSGNARYSSGELVFREL